VWIEYNKPVSRFLRGFAVFVISQTILALAHAQTATVIPANEAASHVNEWATVAKLFTSKSRNTFLNIGAAYPNQTFTGWIPPASPVNKSPILSGIEGQRVKITGQIEVYKGKPEIRINAASQLEVERASFPDPAGIFTNFLVSAQIARIGE